LALMLMMLGMKPDGIPMEARPSRGTISGASLATSKQYSARQFQMFTCISFHTL
jgi:hypothetical protein